MRKETKCKKKKKKVCMYLWSSQNFGSVGVRGIKWICVTGYLNLLWDNEDNFIFGS